MVINKITSVLLFTCLFFNSSNVSNSQTICDTNKSNNYQIVSYEEPVKASVDVVNTIVETTYQEPVENIKRLSDYEVDLISRVVMAEAEDEPLEGKIYVIDTILNRVDSKRFPNTVHDVIYQPSQFTSMWNGRYNRCSTNIELNELIQQEYTNRRNNNIVFFTADRYGEYGTPSFRVANHYFSIYN